MIGRQEDVAAVAGSLSGGGSLIVAGPRRTGKTTVCDAALARLADDGHYVAAVDLFRLADAADFAEQLVLASIANRSSLQRLALRARRAGRQLADAAALTATVHARTELGEDLELAFRPGLASDDPDRYLAYALELPQRIAHADGRRMILFLDEFQEIASPRRPFGDPDRLTKRMRAIFQRSPDVSLLFAGSIEHLMRDLFIPEDRGLSQFGSFYPLAPIPPESWQEGITARLAEDDCTIADPALERLIAAGESHPRATMLIARWTHESSLIDATRKLTDTHVSAGIAAAQAADLPKHEQTLERIRSLGRHAQRIATRVALGSQPYQGLNAKIANETLRALRDAGVIEQTKPRQWRITDPLLRSYLAELDQPGSRT
jgi:RecA/RadA recombinase